MCVNKISIPYHRTNISSIFIIEKYIWYDVISYIKTLKNNALGYVRHSNLLAAGQSKWRPPVAQRFIRALVSAHLGFELASNQSLFTHPPINGIYFDLVCLNGPSQRPMTFSCRAREVSHESHMLIRNGQMERAHI